MREASCITSRYARAGAALAGVIFGSTEIKKERKKRKTFGFFFQKRASLMFNYDATLKVSAPMVQSAIKAHITRIMSSPDLKPSRCLRQVAEIKTGHRGEERATVILGNTVPFLFFFRFFVR